MPTLKERIQNWKEKRSPLKKTGDILFWLLLVLLIIPGPRKFISTGVNKVFLHVKTPNMAKEEDRERLTDLDWGWLLAWDRNEPFYFSNARDEVIFLNFWATWCPPCVAEMPEIQSLYEKYGDKVFFMLVTNEDPETVKAFMAKYEYRLPVFYMGTKPPDVLSPHAYPTTMIISRDGYVVSRKTGAANWDSKATHEILDELIK